MWTVRYHMCEHKSSRESVTQALQHILQLVWRSWYVLCRTEEKKWPSNPSWTQQINMIQREGGNSQEVAIFDERLLQIILKLTVNAAIIDMQANINTIY